MSWCIAGGEFDITTMSDGKDVTKGNNWVQKKVLHSSQLVTTSVTTCKKCHYGTDYRARPPLRIDKGAAARIIGKELAVNKWLLKQNNNSNQQKGFF